MVRAVRETCPRANMDPPNASPFMTTNYPDTEEREFQFGWCNEDCAQPRQSLFSASPSPEHPCWARFINPPMILDNQSTVANTLGQPQHNIFEGRHTTVYNPPSAHPSDPGDSYHQPVPTPVDDTHIRTTPSQSMRPNLPRLVIDSSQVSVYARTGPTNTWHTGEPGINCRYRPNPSDLLQPYAYQGRSPSSSGSDECQSPWSDGSWVDVADEDLMDIDGTGRVPNELSNLSFRQRIEEAPDLGGMEGNSGRERGFAVSNISNDYTGSVSISGLTSAGFSHPHEPTRWSLQAPRDIDPYQSGSRRRRVSSVQGNRDAVSTFNGTACLRCQLKRVPVSVPSARYPTLS